MPKKKDELITFTVNKFSRELRNRFSGRCKMNGERVVDVVTRLVCKYIYEEQQSEQKGR